MRSVVLGGSGFIGSAIVARLREAGHDVRVLAAPRLVSTAARPDAVLIEARGCPDVPLLAEQLSATDVVVLAAGAATPDAADSPVLRGANSLLPVVVALACGRAGVRRMVHLSSAAVQGRRPVLDETSTVEPFSPYSRSKALGEQALALISSDVAVGVVTVRATSVQGRGRRTTAGLRRVAHSRLASVAGRGDAPSAVSSVEDLARFVLRLTSWPGSVPGVVLQPWAGLSAAEVLRLAGGKEPRHLSPRLCRAAVTLGLVASWLAGRRLDGPVRRVEMMWFGQGVDDVWAQTHGLRSIPTATAQLQVLMR